MCLITKDDRLPFTITSSIAFRNRSLHWRQRGLKPDNLQRIPLPPLEEQKRIVSILDEAFEGLDRARENAEANLKSARELFESC